MSTLVRRLALEAPPEAMVEIDPRRDRLTYLCLTTHDDALVTYHAQRTRMEPLPPGFISENVTLVQVYENRYLERIAMSQRGSLSLELARLRGLYPSFSRTIYERRFYRFEDENEFFHYRLTWIAA